MVARLSWGGSLSEWYDKEQPLESSRDGWQIDQAALRTIGDHMEVIVATSALAGWLDLGPQRTGMLDSVRFTPRVS